MERIAPLAKILAEANGIEWQHLSGTGAGGQIVEQDILDYLSRVMSGEAEPPSTPVDAPPPDWNGEDIVPDVSMFDASMLSKAGVESDITDFVSQGRPAGQMSSGQMQVPGTGTPALTTDEFELDDAADESLLAPPAAAPAPVAPVPAVMPAAPVTPAPVTPAPVVSAQPTPPAPAVSVPPVSAPAAAVAGAAAGGLGSLLSRLYHKEETPVPVAAPAPAPTPVPQPVAPQIAAPQVAAPQISAPDFSAPTVPAPVATPAMPAEDRIAVAVAPTMPAPVAPTAPVTEAAPEPALAPAPMPAPEAVPTAQPEPVMPEPVMPEPVTPAAPTAPVAAPSLAAPATSDVPREAVWFGTYLRRTADVSALSDLRGQLAEALERDVPMALLVARAAQRHLSGLNLTSVAMQDVQAGQAHSVGEGSIRDALSAAAQPFGGTPDLLVVDAGTLDLDDLHYPHTLTLSVGRAEDGRASLSLQGEADQAQAAQFLAAVAQTLAKPVILLV